MRINKRSILQIIAAMVCACAAIFLARRLLEEPMEQQTVEEMIRAESSVE
ncbi:MAG: hypothetical protein ACKVX9_01275 [Blastocatellia bacterium]